MQNLPDFRKMVETGVDPRLQWCYHLNKTSLAERLRDTIFNPSTLTFALIYRGASRVRDRAPYSWNMVNLFSFGCHMIDQAYVRTRLQIVWVG